MFSNPALSGRVEVRASTWASCREKDGCHRMLRDTSQGKEVEKRPGDKPGYPPDPPSIPPLAPAIHTANVRESHTGELIFPVVRGCGCGGFPPGSDMFHSGDGRRSGGKDRRLLLRRWHFAREP